MANALFVCLQNAGRSQMSQALFERAAAGRHGARSAGTTPAEQVHPEVVEVMAEIGIDLADREPHGLTEEDARWADVDPRGDRSAGPRADRRARLTAMAPSCRPSSAAFGNGPQRRRPPLEEALDEVDPVFP